MIEHGDLLDDAQRIIPGQDHRAGGQLDLLGAPGEIRQRLHVVRTHGVIIKMMLGHPDRIETQRFTAFQHLDFGDEHLFVAHVLVPVLKDTQYANIHDDALLVVLRLSGLPEAPQKQPVKNL